jgi:hypothetical protein
MLDFHFATITAPAARSRHAGEIAMAAEDAR